MAQTDTYLSLYLIVLVALVARAILYAEPFVPPPPTLVCTKGGFLGLGCATGCYKHGGKCIPKTADAAAPPPPAGPSGYSLMKHRSVSNCLAASDAFEASAVATADVKAAAQLRLLAADAINCAMRTQGDGNILIVEGTVDTPEKKKFWGLHGPRALSLIRDAISADPPLASDPRAKAIELDAFMCTRRATCLEPCKASGAESPPSCDRASPPPVAQTTRPPRASCDRPSLARASSSRGSRTSSQQRTRAGTVASATPFSVRARPPSYPVPCTNHASGAACLEQHIQSSTSEAAPRKSALG